MRRKLEQTKANQDGDMYKGNRGVSGGTQVFPTRIFVGAGLVILLLWLVFSSRTASRDFYGIMIDAGSTGSRIHVYHFESLDAKNEHMDLRSEVFHALKPGLSSFADDPEAGAESLTPLMEIAMSTVPESKRSITPVNLKATAGLRMLRTDQQQALLSAVENKLKSYPFLYDPSDAVEIMEGTNEGKFAWVTVNYLLKTVALSFDRTCVVLDLGGGSTQIAMAVQTSNSQDLLQANIFGQSVEMYIYSHLGLGLMAGRGKMLGAGLDDNSPKLHGDGVIESACLPPGERVTYKYDGKTYVAVGTSSASAFECKKTASSVMYHPTGSFAEAPEQPRISEDQPIFAMSYYFDRAVDVGIIAADQEEGLLQPRQYMDAAQRICGKSSSEVISLYPNVEPDQAPFLCMDLCFISSLLTDGFSISSSAHIRLAQKLDFNGNAIETQWPLGASLEELSEELDKLGL